MMTVMRIVSFAKYGGAECLYLRDGKTASWRWGNIDTGAFAGVNRADLLQREGIIRRCGSVASIGMEVPDISRNWARS